MVSRRLPWDRPSNRLTARLGAWRSAGRPISDLTGTNPVAAGLGPDAEAVRRALDRPEVGAYRPEPRGSLEARRAIAADHARRGADVDPEDVVVTASTSEAYGFLFKLLCDPGDRILTPSPSYPLLEHLSALEGVRCDPYPLRYDGRWHVDVDALRRTARDGARAVVVVHPNNPTGSFLGASELDAVRDVCGRCGAALISDEVFADYPLRDDPHRAGSAASPGAGIPTFALGGLSKSVALPQVKLGWIVVSGPGDGRAAYRERLEWIADTYLSVGTPVQAAAADLLALGPAVRRNVLARIHRNLRRLRDGVAETAVSALDVEGGWSAILRLPAVRTAEDWSLELLDRHGVAVQPGYFYDLEPEAHVVVGLLTPPETFDAGIDAIVEIAGCPD